MSRYALRYLPLLLLALILIPVRIYIVQHNLFMQNVSPSFGNNGSVLYAVTMLASNNVWAVGGSFQTVTDNSSSTPPTFPLLQNQQNKKSNTVRPGSGIILHYTDNHWSAAQVDTTRTALRFPLFSISLDSSTDGWAVGYAGAFVHYDGQQWSIVPSASPANFNNTLLGVDMLSPTDGWAVGYSGAILHYNGQHWTRWSSPTTEDLHSIAMSSAQEGWAVGNNGVILQYSQGNWKETDLPAIQSNLNSISLVSNNEAWAVGDNGTILHLRDNIWEHVYSLNTIVNVDASPPPNLISISMSSIRSGWIIGPHLSLFYSSEIWSEAMTNTTSINEQVNKKLLPQITQVVTAYGVVMTSSDDGWLVGSIDRGGQNVMAMLHNEQGSWSIYTYP